MDGLQASLNITKIPDSWFETLSRSQLHDLTTYAPGLTKCDESVKAQILAKGWKWDFNMCRQAINYQQRKKHGAIINSVQLDDSMWVKNIVVERTEEDLTVKNDNEVSFFNNTVRSQSKRFCIETLSCLICSYLHVKKGKFVVNCPEVALTAIYGHEDSLFKPEGPSIMANYLNNLSIFPDEVSYNGQHLVQAVTAYLDACPLADYFAILHMLTIIFFDGVKRVRDQHVPIKVIVDGKEVRRFTKMILIKPQSFKDPNVQTAVTAVLKRLGGLNAKTNYLFAVKDPFTVKMRTYKSEGTLEAAIKIRKSTLAVHPPRAGANCMRDSIGYDYMLSDRHQMILDYCGLIRQHKSEVVVGCPLSIAELLSTIPELRCKFQIPTADYRKSTPSLRSRIVTNVADEVYVTIIDTVPNEVMHAQPNVDYSLVQKNIMIGLPSRFTIIAPLIDAPPQVDGESEYSIFAYRDSANFLAVLSTEKLEEEITFEDHLTRVCDDNKAILRFPFCRAFDRDIKEVNSTVPRLKSKLVTTTIEGEWEYSESKVNFEHVEKRRRRHAREVETDSDADDPPDNDDGSTNNNNNNKPDDESDSHQGADEEEIYEE